VTELFRLFLSRNIDTLAEDKAKATALSDFHGPKDACAMLLQQVSPIGFEQNLTYRTRVALQISDAGWHNTPQLFKMELGQGQIVGECGTKKYRQSSRLTGLLYCFP